jgi:formate dehydrogenase assembly factor FdhD
MLDFSILYIVVNVLITVVGFFIRQHLIEMTKDIKEIKTQVYKTNGQVQVLNEWKENHTSSDAREYIILNETITNLRNKVDELWKGFKG